MQLIRLPLLFSFLFFVYSLIFNYLHFLKWTMIHDYTPVKYGFISSYLFFTTMIFIYFFSASICIFNHYRIEKLTLKNVILVILLFIILALLTEIVIRNVSTSFDVVLIIYSFFILGVIDRFSNLFDKTDKTVILTISPNFVHFLFCILYIITFELYFLLMQFPEGSQIDIGYNLVKKSLPIWLVDTYFVNLIRLFVGFSIMFLITKSLFKKSYVSIPIADIFRSIGRIWVRSTLAYLLVGLVFLILTFILHKTAMPVLIILTVIAMIVCYIKITRSAVRKYFY